VQQPPRVVVVTGAPGAGKSATGEALARALGAAPLDQDTLTNPLVDVVAAALGVVDYADPRLAEAVRTARYECLLRVAEDCLRSGLPVVLVAPFTAERRDPAAWEALADRLRAAGGSPVLAWLRIGPDELARRVLGRGAARDAAKLADVRSWIAGVDLGAPAAPHLEVDAALAPEEQALDLRERLV
jgi:predicted kinase